jgi:hypothetical protein
VQASRLPPANQERTTIIVERRDRGMGRDPGRKTRGYRKDEYPAHAIDRSLGRAIAAYPS